MVPSPGGLQPPLPAVAHSRGGLVCNQIQQQAPHFCISSPGPSSLGRGCSKFLLGGSGPVCLSTNSPPGQCGEQTPVPWLQKANSYRPGLAQHTLVLGSGGAVSSDSSLPASTPQSGGATVQCEPSQGSGRSEPSYLAPRVEAIKWQGFSDQVAARIEAPQRPSTRTIYKAKWALFVFWCQSNQVDFRSPSIKQVADFLLFLFQEKWLQPSTIEGYRSAVADKLGNSSLNINKDENLNRLLDSFHRDRPKGWRGIPAWNLSLVLHQLTKAPFEPLKKASLKHLTFKTVFLLALGSGKCRSEMHVWLNKNIRHQADWSKVSLYPSSSFMSKNQLARDSPDSVFIYLGFYVAFNTVQVISRRVVGRAEETSTYSSLGFCTVNCRPTASNYHLSHLRPWRGSNPGLRGGRRECYHSATVDPQIV